MARRFHGVVAGIVLAMAAVPTAAHIPSECAAANREWSDRIAEAEVSAADFVVIHLEVADQAAGTLTPAVLQRFFDQLGVMLADTGEAIQAVAALLACIED